MFKDTEEALRRLEAELLAEDEEEEWEDLPEEEEAEEDLLDDDQLSELLEDTQVYGSTRGYQNHANGYRAYNSDDLEQDPEELSRELLDTPKGKGITGLAVLACLLTVGILCVAVWWMARYWGAF